jgi:putative transposase
MSRDYYSEINLHLVWHTKESAPMLRGDVESATHDAIRRRIIQTPGVFVHDIGGIDDHVHLAVTIPPTLLVSDFVGQLKGGTAFEMNKKLLTRHECRA